MHQAKSHAQQTTTQGAEINHQQLFATDNPILLRLCNSASLGVAIQSEGTPEIKIDL